MAEIADVINDDDFTEEEIAELTNLMVVLLREKIAKSEDITPYLNVLRESDRDQAINLLLTGKRA